jgi:hypothetical protein
MESVKWYIDHMDWIDSRSRDSAIGKGHFLYDQVAGISDQVTERVFLFCKS